MADRLTFCASHREETARIGQNAADTLYVSWDDSIARAVERYEEVLRDFRDGRLQLKRPPRNRTVAAFSKLHRAFSRAADAAEAE